jgi:hypothetical protein
VCQPGRSSGAIAAWHPSTRAGVCATLHVAWIDGSPTDPQQIPGGTPTDLRRIPIRSLTGFLQIPDGSPSDPRRIPIRSPTDPHQIPDGSPSDPRRIPIRSPTDSDSRRIPIRSPTDPHQIPDGWIPIRSPTEFLPIPVWPLQVAAVFLATWVHGRGGASRMRRVASHAAAEA